MSQIEVDKVIPQSGTALQVGEAGDTVNIVGTLQNNGAELTGDISSVVAGTGLAGGGTTGDVTLNIEAAQPTVTSTGTLAGFTSTGIDDNATSTAMTIDSSENIGIGTTSPASIGSNITTLEITGGSTVRTGGVKISNSDKSIKGVFYGSNSGFSFGSETNNKLTFFTNNTARAELDTSGNLSFNSGFGSVTTVYGCRSWVNFNGSGTLAIRDSGNVSSVTDQGVGNYTVNFATNMPDVNYASVCSNGYVVSTGAQQFMFTATAEDTHAVGTYNVSNRLVDNDAPTFAAADSTGVMVSIFR